MSAERLRERVSEATRSYPDDGPEYQRGVRSRQWLTEIAPDAIALLADAEEALIPARDLLMVEVEESGDGGFRAVVEVIDDVLARLDALTRSEGVTDAVATPKDSGGGR